MMPSRSDALDVAKGRVNPLMDENSETFGKWIRETDAASIKQIHNGFVYFRGMRSRTGLKSIPVDFLVADELDEAPPQAMDMASERLSHSEFKHILQLSNPTLPDYGVDKAFQETDQRYWLLKCPGCGEHVCLEDQFVEEPESILIEDSVTKALLCCPKCRKELDKSSGQWVAKKPGVENKRGYHFSQLFSAFVDPGEILHQYRTTNNLQDFWNLKIGNAFVEAENRLSIEEILKLCGSDGIASSDPGPTFMGVDQGKLLHTIISKKHLGKAAKVVYISVHKEWEELDGLMKNFKVARAVCDALPETRNAREFAGRHKGKVFLNYYQEHQKGCYRWNEKDLTVACNRTESLDASHNEILQGQIILPKESEVVREFAKHCHNVAKKLEEDEDTGSKRYVYVKLGVDHFRHALNYEAMARQSAPDFLFPDW